MALRKKLQITYALWYNNVDPIPTDSFQDCVNATIADTHCRRS